MTVEVKVPQIGESITEVTIEKWVKNEGEAIERDQALAVLESEKATVELPAESSGTLTRILKKPGETAQVGEAIALIETNRQPERAARPAKQDRGERRPEPAAAKPTTKREPAVAPPKETKTAESAPAPVKPAPEAEVQPNVRETTPAPQPQPPLSPQPRQTAETGGEEEVVPMSRLRRTLARRLVEAQHNAALLTTFNEIDMSAVMGLRKQYAEAFQQKYNVKLGFMSFFVKASIDALKLVPQVNAEVRGENMVFKNHYDIGVAVGGGKGLVVPVLRSADRMSFAEVEMAIGDFARRARENTLKPEELQGGTFTISNGGIYGSLLSTPIINPPQSGILGMHTIQERPVAREGQVVVRPMMYVALTYDHRIVDGREAVTFLKRIKDAIEQPTRMLIEV